MTRLALLPLAALLLPTAVAAEAPATKPKTAETDPMKCRRMPVTGSLAKTKKVCMSASEWRQARDDAMKLGDEKVCSGASCAGAAGPT